uniref:Tudor domain-containing protein n=1 Tax=Parastrongyloides trichosuri TaxID=131310 RepID=A0A0N5A734_PARTI
MSSPTNNDNLNNNNSNDDNSNVGSSNNGNGSRKRSTPNEATTAPKVARTVSNNSIDTSQSGSPSNINTGHASTTSPFVRSSYHRPNRRSFVPNASIQSRFRRPTLTQVRIQGSEQGNGEESNALIRTSNLHNFISGQNMISPFTWRHNFFQSFTPPPCPNTMIQYNPWDVYRGINILPMDEIRAVFFNEAVEKFERDCKNKSFFHSSFAPDVTWPVSDHNVTRVVVDFHLSNVNYKIPITKYYEVKVYIRGREIRNWIEIATVLNHMNFTNFHIFDFGEIFYFQTPSYLDYRRFLDTVNNLEVVSYVAIGQAQCFKFKIHASRIYYVKEVPELCRIYPVNTWVVSF